MSWTSPLSFPSSSSSLKHVSVQAFEKRYPVPRTKEESIAPDRLKCLCEGVRIEFLIASLIRCRVILDHDVTIFISTTLTHLSSKPSAYLLLSTKTETLSIPTPNVSIEQSLKDFRRERVVLNGVPFIPSKDWNNRNEAFIGSLRILADRFVAQTDSAYLSQIALHPTPRTKPMSKGEVRSGNSIANAVLQRSCRTGAGSDSFFVVQNFLCSPETFVTQRSDKVDPPIKIDFFIDKNSGHLMSRVEIKNLFSLFELSSMDQQCDDDELHQPTPFLNVETVIIDESDFDINVHSRCLRTNVQIPTKDALR